MVNEKLLKLKEKLGLESKERKKLRDLSIGSSVYIPYSAIYLLMEQKGERQNFLLMLDLNCNDFYEKETSKLKFKIYKKSLTEYALIEPGRTLLSKKDQFYEQNGISLDFIKKILTQLPIENNIDMPAVAYTEDDIKHKEQLLEKYFAGDYTRLAGRPLSDSEKSKSASASLNYIPNESLNVKPSEILSIIREKLILQDKVKIELHNAFGFENIVTGKQVGGSGIVLYGPGGTGKTEIMKTMMLIFQDVLGCYVSRNKRTKKLHSLRDVRGGKWRGAYEDHFAPIFEEAILEAKKRGKPSLICIDEGDDFVKKQDKQNEEMVNFWKSKVGNTPELIVCIATNLEEKSFDGPATRSGRVVTQRIPLPDQEQVKGLILHFNKLYQINLERKLNEIELDDLAHFIIKNRKPGANINEFCKNFYNITINAVELAEAGTDDYKEIERIKSAAKNTYTTILEYIKRFKEETIKDLAEFTLKVQLFDLEFQTKLKQYEQLVEIKSLKNNFETQVDFSNTLLKFFQSEKGNILLSKLEKEEKLYRFQALCFLVNNIYYGISNNEISQNLQDLKNSEELFTFLEQLYLVVLDLSSEVEFLSAFLEISKKISRGLGRVSTNTPSSGSHNTSPNNNPPNPSGIVSNLINSITGIFDNNHLDVNTIIQSYLSYQDAPLSEDVKKNTLQQTLTDTSAIKYAKVLQEIKDLTPVLKLAKKLEEECIDILNHINLFEISPYTKSQTWAIWDIAKQIYFTKNPSETDSSRYKIANPLTDIEKEKEILFRHIGWEIYTNGFTIFATNHMKSKEEQLNCFSEPNKKKIVEMLALPPISKNNNSLPSDQLANLGKLVVEGLINYNPTNENQPLVTKDFEEDFERNLRQLKFLWVQNKLYATKNLEQRKNYYSILVKIFVIINNSFINYRRVKFNLNTNEASTNQINKVGSLLYLKLSNGIEVTSEEWILIRQVMDNLINNLDKEKFI